MSTNQTDVEPTSTRRTDIESMLSRVVLLGELAPISKLLGPTSGRYNKYVSLIGNFEFRIQQNSVIVITKALY